LWTVFDYDFVGVTDNGGPEHFSALVGLVSALALLTRRGGQLYAATLAAVFLGFTLLVTGPSIGVITFATTVVGAGFVRVLRSVAPHLRRVLVVSAASIAALGLVLVANRGLATRLASEINEYRSVDARYVIWESAINAISTWGWIFGHGTFFWNQDNTIIFSI
jgi:O-antigen ligase